MQFIAAAVLFGLLGHGVSACSPVEQPRDWVDAWITTYSDGSFEEAGSTMNNALSGQMIVDLGDGRVAQRLVTYYGCGVIEEILFVDCRVSAAIIVGGISDPNEILPAGFGGTNTYMIQVPKGALDWSKHNTVDDVIAVAKANDYPLTIDVQAKIAQMAWRNRYDAFNGCKIHYPNSAGASS